VTASQMSRRELLIRRASWGAALVCATCLVATVAVAGSSTVRAWLGFDWVESQPAYQIGQTIDMPPEIFKASPLTVVVFANYTCGACQNSVPEMALMASDLAQYSVPAVLVTSAARTEASTSFARAAGFDDASVWHIDLTKSRVQRVPLFVLVDRNGTVLFSREGVLQAGDRAQVLESVRARGTS
jgi:hypothetical protein